MNKFPVLTSAACLSVLVGCTAAAPPLETTPSPPTADERPLRDVVMVGNNFDGTVTVFDPVTLNVLSTINVVPDKVTRMNVLKQTAKGRVALFFIREVIGEEDGKGHDQLVDDMFTSLDGRVLFVSRPSLADVVAIDLANGQLLWETPVGGDRADHAAISPDGRTFLVSASTEKKVKAINTTTGIIEREFESGDQPHESKYSADGTRIFHASIGRVFLPTESRVLDRFKGDRRFQVVNASDFSIKRYDIRKALEKAGHDWKDYAVRPMELSKDERSVFMQLSFMHGFIEFDLETETVKRIVPLPPPPNMAQLSPGDHPLNSAHHGITRNGDGTKLCIAGTISNYAAIVRLEDTNTPRIIPVGRKPYWSTTSADGRHCYVSVSGDNVVKVISFDDEQDIRTVPVGNHPQRVRVGKMRAVSN